MSFVLPINKRITLLRNF